MSLDDQYEIVIVLAVVVNRLIPQNLAFSMLTGDWSRQSGLERWGSGTAHLKTSKNVY